MEARRIKLPSGAEKATGFEEKLDLLGTRVQTSESVTIPVLSTELRKLMGKFGEHEKKDEEEFAMVKGRLNSVDGTLSTIPPLDIKLQELIGRVDAHETADKKDFADLQGRIDKVEKTVSEIPSLDPKLQGLIDQVPQLSADLGELKSKVVDKEQFITLSEDINAWRQEYKEQLLQHAKSDEEQFVKVNEEIDRLKAKPSIDTDALVEQVNELIEKNNKLLAVVNKNIERKVDTFDSRLNKLDDDVVRLGTITAPFADVDKWIKENIEAPLKQMNDDITRLFEADEKQNKRLDATEKDIEDLFTEHDKQNTRINNIRNSIN